VSRNADVAVDAAVFAGKAAGIAAKSARQAKDTIDPAKQTEREQVARDKQTRLDLELPASTFFARISPRRNRWRDVAEFDERVDTLEQRPAPNQPAIDHVRT